MTVEETATFDSTFDWAFDVENFHDELARLRRGMLGEPAPNLSPARVVFGGQVDVHACSLALPGCATPVLN